MQTQFLSKDTLKRFISDDRLNEVVKNLLFRINEFLDNNPNDIDYEPIHKLSDVLIINSGKLNGLEHDISIGILDREAQRITTAEVQSAVLYIIEQLPAHFWNYSNTNNELSHKSQLIEGVERLHQQQTPFEYDLFICFSTKDRAFAEPVWETLRGYGLRVFVSDEDLKSTVGFSFLDKIDFALSSSQHLVLLASSNALNSVYVRDEYQAFYNDCHVKNPNSRLLIVFKLDNFHIDELPRILRNKQIAIKPEQIVLTLVKENLIRQEDFNKQREEVAPGKEQPAWSHSREAENVSQEQMSAQQNQEQQISNKEQDDIALNITGPPAFEQSNHQNENSPHLNQSSSTLTRYRKFFSIPLIGIYLVAFLINTWIFNEWIVYNQTVLIFVYLFNILILTLAILLWKKPKTKIFYLICIVTIIAFIGLSWLYFHFLNYVYIIPTVLFYFLYRIDFPSKNSNGN